MRSHVVIGGRALFPNLEKKKQLKKIKPTVSGYGIARWKKHKVKI